METITKIQNVLKIWRIRSLTLEGTITVFKTLAISKIAYLSVVSKNPTEIIVQLEKIEKRFIRSTKPKIKNKTISSDLKDEALKNVDMNKKIASLQCSWIKRIYDGSFHEWKLILLKPIKKSFGDELNLSFNKSSVRHSPCFYKKYFAKLETVSMNRS